MAFTSPTMTIMMRAAEKAARSLLRDFNEVENLQVSVKGPHNFVSAADKRAEKIIFEELSKARPDYGFIMEESGKVNATRQNVFVVDPLDGTDNFLHGIPHWSINIGYMKDGEILAGLTYDPVRDELFYAEKGSGAFLRNRRLRVSNRQELHRAKVCGSTTFKANKDYEKVNKRYQKMRNADLNMLQMGGTALDMAYIAAGRYDAGLCQHFEIWDVVPGILMIKEAGGTVYSLDKNVDPAFSTALVAGNGNVDRALMQVVEG